MSRELENNIAIMESHQSKSWDAFINANPQDDIRRVERAFSFAYRSSWKNATEAMQAKIDAQANEIDFLRSELSKVNNEFGSCNHNWPDAWKRVADLKKDNRDYCFCIDKLTEELKALRAFVKNVIEESQDDQLFQQWVVEDGLIDGNGNPTKLLTGENNG